MTHALPAVEQALLLAFLATLAAHDTATSRIPNLLTLPFAAVGLGMHAFDGGLSGLLDSLLGALTVIPLLGPLYATGGVGAGDIKALAAVGVLLGPLGVFWATIWSLFFGGIGGLLLLFSHDGPSALRSLLHRWAMRSPLTAGHADAAATQCRADDPSALRFPYGLAIAFGTAASLLWR